MPPREEQTIQFEYMGELAETITFFRRRAQEQRLARARAREEDRIHEERRFETRERLRMEAEDTLVQQQQQEALQFMNDLLGNSGTVLTVPIIQ